MLRILFCLGLSALLVLAGESVAQERQNVAPPFSITISVAETTAKAGTPIILKVKLTNTSDRVLDVGEDTVNGRIPTHVDVRVVGPDGRPALETDESIRHHGRNRNGGISIGGPGTTEKLEPGQSVYEEEDLSKSFDLSKQGKYRVHGERGDRSVGGMVKSNEITIAITP